MGAVYSTCKDAKNNREGEGDSKVDDFDDVENPSRSMELTEVSNRSTEEMIQKEPPRPRQVGPSKPFNVDLELYKALKKDQ